MKIIISLLTLVFCSGFIYPQEWNIPELEKTKYSGIFKNSEINYPGDNSFDALYYKLELKISVEPEYLTGKVTVSGSSLINRLDSVFLDLSDNLTVDSVLSVSGEKLSFNHRENLLFIRLPQILNLNEKFDLCIFYQGKPVATGLRSFIFQQHNGAPSVWSLSEPYGARDWWPCKDTPADKADSSEVWITCPAGLIAVSNGLLTEEILDRDGNKIFKWKSSYPIANYLISIAVSNYLVYEDHFRYENDQGKPDSMPVIHYIYPEDFERWKSQLDKTPGILEVFSGIFGPYPFLREKYGHAQFGGGGMEHQTVSSMVAFNDRIMVHELAHQWFGDKVTCRDWQNIWLNEGFATYSEAIYTEAVSGTEEYNSYVTGLMNHAKDAQGSIYVQDISAISEVFNGPRSYSKGGVVLHMLRGIVGYPALTEIFKEYLNDPDLAYNVAVTEDFQEIVEQVTGNDFDFFFSEWIYGENYPQYFVDWKYEKSGGLYRVDFTIKQAVNTSPEFFTMPVRIKISTKIMDTLFTVFNNSQAQDFSIFVPGEPLALFFDPENLILKDVLINDPAFLLNKMELEQNYPNPFNASTKIWYRIGVTSRVIISLIDILGNEISKLVDENKSPGYYDILLDERVTGKLSSGIYFYRLTAEHRSGIFTDTKKLIFIK